MHPTAYLVLGFLSCWVLGLVLRRWPRPSARLQEAHDFAGFSDHAQTAMHLACVEAQRLGHDRLGTEHFLLGLLRQGEGVAVEVLTSLDLDLRAISDEVERRARGGPPMGTVRQLLLDTGPRTVLDLAMQEAAGLGHRYIGSEHLLLGLIREGDGIAAEVLRLHGVWLNEAREQVLEVLGRWPDDWDGDQDAGAEDEGPRDP